MLLVPNVTTVTEPSVVSKWTLSYRLASPSVPTLASVCPGAINRPAVVGNVTFLCEANASSMTETDTSLRVKPFSNGAEDVSVSSSGRGAAGLKNAMARACGSRRSYSDECKG